ncbi:MAG: calcium-binding protein [Calothrix sp. MO_167.B12]|nr:calcium-binding protein [Calothrix sp. MO_167.B12]
MSGNTQELKFLYPVTSTNTDPLFAEATGSATFFNYSQNASGSLTSVDLNLLINGGVTAAIADADATFINNPTFTELFTQNIAVGDDGAFQVNSTSETQVVANFQVSGGQSFSFDFIANLGLTAKEIEDSDAEYSQAKSTTTFAVLNITNGVENAKLVDYFGITGNLISSYEIGTFQSGSSGNITFTSFGDTDVDGDNGTDFVTNFASGSYQRTFSSDTQLAIVKINTSFVKLRGDTLINNLGSGVQYGTIWDDYLQGTYYNDKIYASLGNDTVKGYDGNDIIEGGGGDDWLYGGDGRDSIHGGSGDDYIDGGYGLDYIDGGSGYDTVSYAARWNDVYLDLATGIVSFSGYGSDDDEFDDDEFDDDDYINSNNGGTETVHNIEKVIGSQGNDRIYGDDGDNHLEGYDGYDYINGRGGNDYIDGGYGYDTLDGGSGYDTVSYAARDNDLHLNLKTGVVTFSGYSGTERVYNFEKVIGSRGHDTIYGDDGANHLDGYDGNDTIFGDDNYWGVSGNDIIDGGKGYDWIKAGGGSDTVKGGTGGDTIYGDYVNEGSGYDGDDYLVGGAGYDTITGGGGHDRIIGTDSYAVGAHEQDVLKGGSDADIFVLGDSHQAYYIANGQYDFAKVKDFTVGEDILELYGSVGDYQVNISYGDAYISHTANGMHDLVAVVENVYSGFHLNSNAVFV